MLTAEQNNAIELAELAENTRNDVATRARKRTDEGAGLGRYICDARDALHAEISVRSSQKLFL